MVQSALTWKLFFNRQHQGEGFALFTYLSDLALGALLLGFSVFPITSRILVVAELCVTIFYFWVISFLIWVWVISLLSGYPFSLFRVTPLCCVLFYDWGHPHHRWRVSYADSVHYLLPTKVLPECHSWHPWDPHGTIWVTLYLRGVCLQHKRHLRVAPYHLNDGLPGLLSP